jgi:hypothetical protein
MMPLKSIVAIALLSALLLAPASANIRIGDWRLVENLLDLTGFEIHPYYENERDKTDVRFVGIGCQKADGYLLRIIGICRRCTSATKLPLRVTIDGQTAFALSGELTEEVPRGGLHDGQGAIIEASLSTAQVQTISEMKASISVEAPGYSPIALPVKQGTKAAFATLQAACWGTRHDPTISLTADR